MIVLSKEQVILLHEELIIETGGSPGLKDEGMLESALAAPFQTFDGQELFPSIYQKAARLGYGLASNHAFIDGNKRIGAHVMLVFLALNGIGLEYEQDELSDLFIKIAEGSSGYPETLLWVIQHIDLD
ncbi:MAG: type II toxin-antitoxin system death-on-curing family toxin [Erysipelotrichaceae bacterium]|nr:type II toxin-antitoxin system death-on-curing family toxin [Erysipelotrichaceae bacterium]